MSEQQTNGIATVMFTDVESSTDITTRLGDNVAAALLATTDRIVLDQVDAHGGRDVRSTGDGFLVIFDSPRAAVSCALAIQRELTEQEHPIRVRVGLNAGEVLEGDDELFGAAINLAARVMDRADGGQILATDTVRGLVGTMTAATFRDRGRVTLKGFSERQRLYEVRPAAIRAEPPPVPRAKRRSRRRLFVAGAAVLVACAVVAVMLSTGSGSAHSVAVPPNAVAAIDPNSGRVVEAIRVDENPGAVAGGVGQLWVLNLDSDTVSRIDLHTHKLLDTHGVSDTVGNLATSPQEVWVETEGCSNGGTAGKLLHLYSARGGDLSGGDELELGSAYRHSGGAVSQTDPGCGLAARGNAAWLATNVPAGVARADYDPAAAQSSFTWAHRLSRAPAAIADGFGSIWAVDSDAQVLLRIDEAHGKVLDDQIHAGADPVAVATGDGSVWVANAGDNSVSRIDPQTNGRVQTIGVGKGPDAIAIGAGGVWVASADDWSVDRIDPRTNQVTKTIALGHRPQGIAVAGGLVWVTVRG
jgi:YVTN family beta-propeller protein